MISHPDPDTVVNELGDKVVGALVHAVAVAKQEFTDYRTAHPEWVASHARRTLASWIHDRIWASVLQELDQVEHVYLVDEDPKREITVLVESNDRLSYRLRIKLHHLDGRTSSYQTQTVIDFELQGNTVTFPGWGETRLEAGYEWDKDTRTIGAPVISLRDGRDKVIWEHPLPEQGEPGAGTVVRPTQPQPSLPDVEAPEPADENTGNERA